MHPLVENFLERPRSHKIGAWVASIGLILLLFWQYSYSPLLTESNDLHEKVDALQSKVTQETRIARDLQKIKNQVKELDQKLLAALRELPDKKEIPELLSTISSLARDAGLEVTSFQPKPELKNDFYAEVPVSIAVEGSYHQLATFFDEVGHLTRIVNIGEISAWQPYFMETKIVRGTTSEIGKRMPIRASCTATTFRYLEESERVKPELSDDKKKRRKK